MINQGLNLLDENILQSRTSKGYVVYFFVVTTYTIASLLKNAAVDFTGDVVKQIPAFLLATGFIQVLNIYYRISRMN